MLDLLFVGFYNLNKTDPKERYTDRKNRSALDTPSVRGCRVLSRLLIFKLGFKLIDSDPFYTTGTGRGPATTTQHGTRTAGGFG